MALPDVNRPSLQADRPRAVTWRSVALGLLGVCLIALLTPYNNYVLQNTDLVGCYLPTGLLLFIGALVLLVNPALSWLRPGREITRGELAVIMGMLLVASAIPAGGLMRYLPGNLVGIYHHSAANASYQQMLEKMGLPDWIFPTFNTDAVQSRGNEPVIRGFVGRIATENNTFSEHVAAVPWGRWVRPALTWSIFLAALYGAVFCMVFTFRRQWMENERLSFPIASVLSAVIEPPEAGRRVNSLFRSRLFWIAAGIVFALHCFNALNVYQPKVPAVPLKWDLSAILANAPFNSVDDWAKKQTIYLSVIGMTCLIEQRLSLSLWVCFLLLQIVRMVYGSYQAEFSGPMQEDQFFGGLLPYTAVGLWVARHHLKTVWYQMLRGPHPGEPRARYMPYRSAGWVFLACLVVQVVWLMAVGCTLAGAVVLVLMLLMIFFALTRMAAETGLLYVTFTMSLNSPWQYTATQLPEAMAVRTNLTTNFLSQMFTGVFAHDVRQALPVYASTAVAVADREYERHNRAKPAMSFVLLMVLALGLSIALSGVSMLYCEYAYASSLAKRPESPINNWGANDQPHWWTLEPSQRYVPPEAGPKYPHNRLGHVAAGATVTGLLSFGRLTWSGFPLHPLGYLLALTLGVRWVWFSLFLGWLLKTVILRMGGATLFRELKPLAIGLIMGEIGAAAFWLVVSVIRAAMGLEYQAIQIILT